MHIYIYEYTIYILLPIVTHTVSIPMVWSLVILQDLMVCNSTLKGAGQGGLDCNQVMMRIRYAIYVMNCDDTSMKYDIYIYICIYYVLCR